MFKFVMFSCDLNFVVEGLRNYKRNMDQHIPITPPPLYEDIHPMNSFQQPAAPRPSAQPSPYTRTVNINDGAQTALKCPKCHRENAIRVTEGRCLYCGHKIKNTNQVRYVL